jgi:hypothetical protein
LNKIAARLGPLLRASSRTAFNDSSHVFTKLLVYQEKVEVAGVEPHFHREAKSLNNADLVDC